MEEWTKPLGSHAGEGGGWREELPLSTALPSRLVIDATRLGPCHPMFLLRLRTFVDWHLSAGREVNIVAPERAETRRQFESVRLTAGWPSQVCPGITPQEGPDQAVVPVTRVVNPTQIDDLAAAARELVHYHLTDVSILGDALHMALSELSANALEHGRNEHGAYVVVQRFTEPRRMIVLAVSDLGIGIPEHLRQQYPEWSDDAFAIAQAMKWGVTGTGDRHRGNGLAETLDRALTTSLHAATLDVQSARGFLRTQVVQGNIKHDPIPPTQFRRGTWISYSLVSV